MKRRLQTPMEERLHRFLRPGALARLRDSRISARASPRPGLKGSIHLTRLSLPSSQPTSPSSPVSDQIDGFPCFVSRSYGPRFPQRKKLAAAKSISFLPTSPLSPEASDSV